MEKNMHFENNLQYLRKLTSMTQEDLAEKLAVSRQTISKWESGTAYPEMEKIFVLADLFNISLDKLLREDLTKKRDAYSDIRIETIERFRMARYVVISPEPENDSIAHMEKWLSESGLLDYPGYKPRLIGWDFPFLSTEQINVYGLRGYVSAYIIPENFTPLCGGAEIAWQDRDTYAVITITDPFRDAFDLIPNAYKTMLAYIKKHKLEMKACENRICFEEVYEHEGIQYMDVHIPIDQV
jgi:transcriptional regulator with XRE-family HTH domain